mgnify:CR=1 FL=1
MSTCDAKEERMYFDIAKINKNELTKKQIAKAVACETAEELMAAAKADGIELTKDEAEAYLAELSDVELDEEMLKQAAGGAIYEKCSDRCYTLDGCGALT